ncbi:unnamed protein product [Calypogeia fissa]
MHQRMACNDRSMLLPPSGHPRYDDTFGWALARNGGSRHSIKDLEASLANLYEDMEEKIKATIFIYGLTRRTEWLEIIINHGSALASLARVLREDRIKSFKLRFNIISIFFMLSLFPKFHQILLDQKIGKTTLKTLILEVQCMEAQIQLEAAAGTAINSSNSLMDRCASEVKIMLHNTKQDRLLYMSISLLLNIAEDLSVEKRMKKCNLVEYLCKILIRKSITLLIITMTFLKKLSIFKENTTVMKEHDIIYRLSVLIPCQHKSLLLAVLRLLWNLSFDPGLRVNMIKCQMVQALEMLLKDKKFEQLVFGLLYNLSTDMDNRIEFLETEIVPMVLQAMIGEPMKLITKELMALAINLTNLLQLCEIMCQAQGVERLVIRAINLGDPLLFKLIKNLSQLETAKPQLNKYLRPLVDLLTRPDLDLHLQVEVMGILNNLTSTSGRFDQLLEETTLLQFLSEHLQANTMEDDIILEVVIFLGAINSETNSTKIAQAGLVNKMITVFFQKGKDYEIILQLLYTFGQFLLHEPTRRELFAPDNKVVLSILELSQIHLVQDQGDIVEDDFTFNLVTMIRI